MRRKDREMDKGFAIPVIDRSRYGVLSMVDEDSLPYGLPLSIVRKDNTLYFHSAKEGRKVEILRSNPHISIAFIGSVHVPENYSKRELDEIAKDESKAALLISSVFTTEFESAIVSGQAKIVEDQEEKTMVMELICKKYTPDKMDYFPMAIKAGLSRTNVYSVKMENISAKRKKYDSQGEEMKWGRMD